jgi:glycosyltransferase involved in cell wall biosynthesis
MKVLQITPVAPPQHSGMANAAGEIYKATSANGADVSLVTAFGDSTVKSLKSYRVPGAGLLAFSPAIIRLMKNADIVHLHYPCFGNALLVSWAYRLGAKAPLVVSYHMDAVGRGLRRPIFWFHRCFIAPFFLRRAVKIVVASRDYAANSLLGKHPKLMEKVVEIPFGVDTERFHPPASRMIGMKRVLFVAALDEQHYFKGLNVLLASLADVPEAKLTVVGGGSLLEHYRAEARRLGIAERVEFAGRVSDEELPEYHRRADVFCAPSVDRSEAYSIASLEAEASGLPCVATMLPGVRSVVHDGETGLLVKPNDPIALASALKKLLGDDALRSKMGENARTFALTRTWPEAGKRYLEIYNEIIRTAGLEVFNKSNE